MILLLAACAPEDGPRPGGGLALAGTVADGDGAPIGGATLQACASVCFATDADEDGAFRFNGLDPDAWSLHALADDAVLVVPVELADDVEVELFLSPLGPEVPVPAAVEPVPVAPGLVVELGEPTVPGIAAVRAAVVDRWPALPGVDGAVVAGWSLAPFGAGTDLPFAADAEGAPFCTAADGRSWVACDALPNLGSLILVR